MKTKIYFICITFLALIFWILGMNNPKLFLVAVFLNILQLIWLKSKNLI